MIKQGTRKSLRTAGTLLRSNVSLSGWDDSGNPIEYIVGGDILMVTGEHHSARVEVVVFATGRKTWFKRDWIVNNTSLVYDARVTEAVQDA